MQNIQPASGWSLDFIAELDVHSPGIAGHFLRASDERRQVIAALLALQPFPTEERSRTALAHFLNHASHKDILEAALIDVPNGLRGALARSGPQPHPRPYYRMLARVLSCGPDAGVAAVIKRLDNLDLTRLRVAQTLPKDICTPALVSVVGSVRSAIDVSKLVDLLTLNGIDRAALAEAIRRATSESQLSNLWARWSQKLTLPPHPVAASENYRPLRSGEELRQIALRYRNCARRYIAETMEGHSAFAEFKYAGKRGVVHLGRDGNRWKLRGLFGKDNTMLAPEIRSAARTYLEQQGVQVDEPQRATGEWDVLRRLTGVQFLEF